MTAIGRWSGTESTVTDETGGADTTLRARAIPATRVTVDPRVINTGEADITSTTIDSVTEHRRLPADGLPSRDDQPHLTFTLLNPSIHRDDRWTQTSP